jgi:hypothetical protein
MRTLSIADKNFFEVPTSIQHADDFGNVVAHTIENDVRACGDRSQTWPHLVASSTGKRMLFEQTAGFTDAAHDPIRRVSTGNLT